MTPVRSLGAQCGRRPGSGLVVVEVVLDELMDRVWNTDNNKQQLDFFLTYYEHVICKFQGQKRQISFACFWMW